MKNPLSQAKDLYKLQKEARDMQKKMQQLSFVGESKNGEVKVTINGAQEINNVQIEDFLMSVDQKERFVQLLKDAIKDGQKKVQKELVKDMDLDKLKSMLG